MRLYGKLAIGAYLLEARSDKQPARDLILVTDASLVLRLAVNKRGLLLQRNHRAPFLG